MNSNWNFLPNFTFTLFFIIILGQGQGQGQGRGICALWRKGSQHSFFSSIGHRASDNDRIKLGGNPNHLQKVS